MKIPIIKHSADGFLFALLLAAVLLVATPTPGDAQGSQEVVLYAEDFNDGKAQGWELEEDGWAVVGGTLFGHGHTWARYTKGHWDDVRRVAFRLIKTYGVHVNVCYSDIGRYAIGFRPEGESLFLYLFKQLWPDRFFNDLATRATGYSIGIEHQVEIIMEEGRIRVMMDGKLMIDYTDPDPLPPGTIAFESLEDTMAHVDDVVVFGPRVEEPEHLADLVVRRVKYEIVEEGRLLVITAEVENAGNTTAPPVIVRAEAPGWANETTIHQLDTDGIAKVRIALKISDELRNRTHPFEVLVDPENKIEELSEDNNRQAIEVSVPDGIPPPEAFSLPWGWIGIAALFLGLGIAAGRALTLRTRQTWQRAAQLQWQLEAITELPEPKEACTWACKVNAKTELLKRWKIAALQLTPLPLPSGKTPLTKRIEGKILDRLTEAGQPQYLLEDKAQTRQRVVPVVEAVLEQILAWKKEGQTPASIKVDAHLVRDVKCEFKLFHCEKISEGLEWVDSRVRWKSTLHQPGGEFLGTMRGPMADEPDFTQRARVELEGFLLQLVKGVRFKL